MRIETNITGCRVTEHRTDGDREGTIDYFGNNPDEAVCFRWTEDELYDRDTLFYPEDWHLKEDKNRTIQLKRIKKKFT